MVPSVSSTSQAEDAVRIDARQRERAAGFGQRLFDPVLLALIAVAFVAAVLLPNPLDPEGSIDAFIYHAYALDFSNLINRYGPFYFSYRVSHTFWLWAARTIFGFQFAPTALVGVYLSTIAVSSWVILRPYLPRIALVCLVVPAMLSPWTIKTMATSYLDATCVCYLFVLIALLVLNERRHHESWRLAFAAGCILGLIVNANTYLVIFGGLIFVAHFAVPLERATVARLFRSGLVAVAGFVVTQFALWLMWAAVLRLGSGTPMLAILHWTWISLHGGAWDSDMFSIAVGRAQAQILTTDPRPFVWRMLREGEVRVIVPPVVIASAVIYRLWSAPKLANGLAGRLLKEWDAVTLGAVLVVGYCYVTSESAGNQMLSAPFYFSYMIPAVYLTAALALTFAWQHAGRSLLPALGVTSGVAAILYLVAVFFPAAIDAAAARGGLVAAVVWVTVVLALLAPIPLWKPQLSGWMLALVVMLVGPIFFASGSGYRIPYSSEMYLVSRDVLDAEKALIDFVEKNAPPPGVHPNSRPVIFWYTNSSFMDSLSGAYLSDYEALDGGHGRDRLPRLDDRALAQLKAGYRREIVLVYHKPEELVAAQAALRDIGVEFEQIGQMTFKGARRDAGFSYIRVTRLPV